jgi:hypothetical protein
MMSGFTSEIVSHLAEMHALSHMLQQILDGLLVEKTQLARVSESRASD